MRRKMRLGMAASGVFALCFIAASASQSDPPAAAGQAPAATTEALAASDTLATGLPDLFAATAGSADLSSQERQVLDRATDAGRISASDYEDTNQRYRECMTERGFVPEFRKSSQGFYVQLPFRSVTDHDALDAAHIACTRDTMTVESLYRVQQANPDLLADSRLVAVQCLQVEGYLSDEYTARDFEHDWTQNQFPFDATEASANDCLWGAGYGYFVSDD